jgi:anti-sigma factor RsiW
MTCREFRKQLIPWLDGELKPDKAAELMAWLNSCDEVRQCHRCRKLTEEYRSFHVTFQNTPQKEFPAFLHHRIMAEIINKEQVRAKHHHRISWQAIPATIAILLSLYFGSLVGVKTFNTQSVVVTEVTETTEQLSFGENGMVSTIYSNGETE